MTTSPSDGTIQFTDVRDMLSFVNCDFYPMNKDGLIVSFVWGKTVQGHAFWSNCSKGEIPESEWRPIVDLMFASVYPEGLPKVGEDV